MDNSPRIHALNIAKLSAETINWEVFLRAHLDIMKDKFERMSDGSYAFGGRNDRNTDAYAFTRNDGERVVESIYPGGYTPRITSKIIDNSAAFGFKAKAGDWKIDLSNAFGQNAFDYTIKGTLNASLEDDSPTEFDAGGFSLSQNTTNLDFSRNFKSVLNGLNFAFGGEYLVEKYWKENGGD